MALAFEGPLKGSSTCNKQLGLRFVGRDAAIVVSESGILFAGETEVPDTGKVQTRPGVSGRGTASGSSPPITTARCWRRAMEPFSRDGRKECRFPRVRRAVLLGAEKSWL